jgi:hypothetical protein
MQAQIYLIQGHLLLAPYLHVDHHLHLHLFYAEHTLATAAHSNLNQQKINMSTTAPLEPYIRRALDIPTSVIFTPSNHVRTPTLHKDRVNRILIFCGSFNPPHRGHKEALCHAFFRSGTDLNIIAAFIVTLSEESVKFKQLRRSRNDIPIVFTKEQKLELWNTSGLYGGWHWCYPGRKLGCRREFLRISKEAAKDGFEIQFINLYGEDLIDRDDIDLRGEFLVCGAGDPERSSIRDELSDVGIKPVNHFTQWQKLGMDRDLPWQLGTAGNAQWMEMILIMLYPDKAKDLPIERK